LNHHFGARIEIGANFYKTRVINLGGYDFDHPVINWSGVATYTHNAMYASGETDLMKQIVRREPSKEISRKQGFNKIGRGACKFIETAVPYPGKKSFHVPSR